jgi:thioredoxin-dependent peroxiredoxin
MDDTGDDVIERHDEAYELDERLTVVGGRLAVGDEAPAFALACLDPETEQMREVSLADSAGEVRLLNVVNSLDTAVCQVETRRWEQLRADVPSDVRVYTISMDLPFGQARWRRAEGVEHDALSAHASERFGREYGVLLKEWRLLQRAVFVIDAEGIVVHAEYVADQMAEPDYDAALRAAGGTG